MNKIIYIILFLLLLPLKFFSQTKAMRNDSLSFLEFYHNFPIIDIEIDYSLHGKNGKKVELNKNKYFQKLLIPFNTVSLNFKSFLTCIGRFETDKYYAVIYNEYYNGLPYHQYRYLITFSKTNFKPIDKILFSNILDKESVIQSTINENYEILSRTIIREYDDGNLFPDKCPTCFEIREYLNVYKIQENGEIIILKTKPVSYYIAKYGNYEEPMFVYPIIVEDPIFEEYNFKKEKDDFSSN